MEINYEQFQDKDRLLGPISTNCYLVYNDRTKAGVIVDPADNGAYILNKCSELGLKPRLCSHPRALRSQPRRWRMCGGPSACRCMRGRRSRSCSRIPEKNLSFHMWPEQVSFRADELLHDGDSLDLLGFQWKVLATPGHTAEVSVITCPRRTSCLRGIRFLRIPLAHGHAYGEHEPAGAVHSG